MHPSSHPANVIQQDSTHRFVTDTEKTKWNNSEDAAYKRVQEGINITGLLGATKQQYKMLDYNIGSQSVIPSNCCVVNITGTGSGGRYIDNIGVEQGQMIWIRNYSKSRFQIIRNDNAALASWIPSDYGVLFQYKGKTWLPVIAAPSYIS